MLIVIHPRQRPPTYVDHHAHLCSCSYLPTHAHQLSARTHALALKTVAAILHLGNHKFIVDCSHDVDAAVVRNTDTLALVCFLY